MYILIRRNITIFPLTQNVICNQMCSDYTWIVYLVCIWSSSVTPEMDYVSIVFKPKWTDTCWNVCDLTAILLEHITVVLSEQGHCLQGEETLGIVLHRCVWWGVVQCVSFPSSSPLFPYCSALYDNVVVNSLQWACLRMTSKPQWTPSCSLGFTRTGLVAVLCNCVVLSLPTDSETSRLQLFSFPATSVPVHFGPSAQFSQKHPQCGSLTVPCYLASVRVQEAGESSEASAKYASLKICAIT